MSRKIKSLTKIFLRLQRRLVYLQCNVKRTRWSDYVSRFDLSLSFLSSRKKRQTKNNGNIASVLIILHHLTKLHAFIGKVKNAWRIIEKRCNALAFKCVKNAFHFSAVVTLLLFWANDVWCYDAHFVTNYVKEDCDAAWERQNGPGGSVHLGHSFTLFI